MGQRADEVRRRDVDVEPVDQDTLVVRETETTAMYRDPSSPEAIEAEIEQTRAEMSETIDAIQERLSPQQLKEQAKDAVYEATVGRAQQTAKGAGSSMWQTIKQHPLPAAIAGMSLGYLFMKGASGSSSKQQHARTYYEPSYQTDSSSQSTTGQMKEQAGQMASQARDTAEQYGQQARDTAQQYSQQAQQQAAEATDWFQQQLRQNPLSVGAVAVALGAAVGLAVPETQQENEMMGQARDSLMQKAQSKAADTMHKVQHVAQEATRSAKQEAKEQGLKS
jgi:ElaB/YqjD/DUF883 family membrane-anchored ribosome-binding protein